MPEPSDRFVAFDLHQGDVVIGALNGHLEVVLPIRRVPLAQLDGWVQKHLQPTDQVVFEAGNHAWYVYDLVQPLVARVVVANPRDIQLIAASCVKTDKHDTLVLARLLAANLVPAVWVPPPPVRHLRALIRHRQRLVSQAVAVKNRLQAVLQRHHLVPPGDPFGSAQRTWWQELPLAAPEKLLTAQNLVLLDQLHTLTAQAGAELARSSVQEPWAAQTAFLIQLPGIGLLSAMTILAAIGDITRFPSPKELVGYAGLGTRVHDTGQTHRSGGINKEGRRELRTVLVEAAWVAVEQHPYWKEQFARLAARIGQQKAIVAIARKLLVVVWHVLAEQVADRQAQEEQVARSLLNWGADHRLATSLGLSRPEFVRQELDRLGLGQELQQFRYSQQLCRLPPSSLVLQPGAALPVLSRMEPADVTT
jgi:transposase